jgi:hypothetical protein
LRPCSPRSPGRSSGRWPHIHREIFKSRAVATIGTKAVLTTPLALPSAVANTIYNSAGGYSASVATFKKIIPATDNLFRNDIAAQLAAMTPAMTGSITSGYVATAIVGVPL